MALRTLGTTGTTVLSALAWNPQSLQADVAQITANIKLPKNPAHPITPGAFGNNGILYFPQRRGWLALAPGDYIAYDSNGWPIVISNESIAGNPNTSSWTHT